MRITRRVALILGLAAVAVLSVAAFAQAADRDTGDDLSDLRARARQAAQREGTPMVVPVFFALNAEGGREFRILKADTTVLSEHEQKVWDLISSSNWEALEQYGELTPKARQLMAEGRVNEFVEKYWKD